MKQLTAKEKHATCSRQLAKKKIIKREQDYLTPRVFSFACCLLLIVNRLILPHQNSLPPWLSATIHILPYCLQSCFQIHADPYRQESNVL
jgi:hypothetical protein